MASERRAWHEKANDAPRPYRYTSTVSSHSVLAAAFHCTFSRRGGRALLARRRNILPASIRSLPSRDVVPLHWRERVEGRYCGRPGSHQASRVLRIPMVPRSLWRTMACHQPTNQGTYAGMGRNGVLYGQQGKGTGIEAHRADLSGMGHGRGSMDYTRERHARTGVEQDRHCGQCRRTPHSAHAPTLSRGVAQLSGRGGGGIPHTRW